MEVYADLIFDAISPEGDMETFTIVTRFRDEQHRESISNNYRFDDIIPEIEEILPYGYTIDSEIEFGNVYNTSVAYELDLSWLEV